MAQKSIPRYYVLRAHVKQKLKNIGKRRTTITKELKQAVKATEKNIKEWKPFNIMKKLMDTSAEHLAITIVLLIYSISITALILDGLELFLLPYSTVYEALPIALGTFIFAGAITLDAYVHSWAKSKDLEFTYKELLEKKRYT